MAQDPTKIHIGAARIWLGVTPPATGTPRLRVILPLARQHTGAQREPAPSEEMTEQHRVPEGLGNLLAARQSASTGVSTIFGRGLLRRGGGIGARS